MKMTTELKTIAENHSLTFTEDNNEYDLSFDIRNLPSKQVVLTRHSCEFSIVFKFEFLWGTSEKPSFFSGNNPDKYIVHLNFTSKKSKYPNFRVVESSLWNKWIRKVPMRIYCKNDSFKKELTQNKAINNIYSKCIETAELSPSISSVNENGNLEMNINFQSFIPHYDVMDAALSFCLEMESEK